jgi:large subunit ribosomal protein L13
MAFACGKLATQRDCEKAARTPILKPLQGRHFGGFSPRSRLDESSEFMMRTYSPKASEVVREWHVVDADGLVLGRMATEVASILRGKHKPMFSMHMDTGDHVVIVNASKIVLTKGKADSELVHDYSGYPGGLRTQTYGNLLSRKPEDAIRRTIRGMLPKGPLGRQMIKKLKVHAGPEHGHEAQNPKVLNLPHAKAR